jgi:TP901 family phage tail tape measure protein
MASLGNISSTFTANVEGFISGIQKMNNALNSMVKKFKDNQAILSKGIIPPKQVTKDFGHFMNTLESGMDKAGASTDKATTLIQKRMGTLKGVYGTVTTTTKMMGDKIVSTHQSVAEATSQSFRGMISTMLNWKSFVSKIVHYITFSIGVQLVMAIRSGITNTIRSFMEFEKAVYQTASVAGYLGKSFDGAAVSIKNFAVEVTKGTIFTAGDAANSLYDLASAGFDVVAMARKGESALASFRSMMDYAMATGTDLKTTVSHVTEVIKQFNLTIDDTSMIVDTFTTVITSSFLTLEKISQAMKYAGTIAGILGRNVQEVTASMAVLADTGMEGGQIGQRLNMVFTRLLKPTDDAVEMLQAMSLTLTDINPQYNSLTSILYKLEAAQFGAAEAAGMFKARTAAAAAALVDGASEVANHLKRMKMASGITSEIAEKQEESLSSMVAIAKSSFYTMSVEMGEALKPALAEIIKFMSGPLTRALKSLGSMFMIIAPVLKHIVILLITYIMAIKLVAVYTKIWAAITKIQTTRNLTLRKSIIALIATKKVLIATSFAVYGIMFILFDALANGINMFHALAAALIAAGAACVVLKTRVFTLMKTIEISSGPIGWVLLIIGAIVGAISILINREKELSQEMKDLVEVQKQLSNELEDSESALNKYSGSIDELVDRLQKESEIRDRIRKLEEEGKTATEEYTQALVDLSNIIKEVSDSEEGMIRHTSAALNILRDTTDTVANGITYYQQWKDADVELLNIEDSLTTVIQRKNTALLRSQEAALLYGEEHENFAIIQNEIISLGQEEERLLEQKNSLIEQSTKSHQDYNKELDNANKAEKESIKLGIQIYELRTNLINLMERRNKLTAQQNVFDRMQTKWTKYIDEATKNLIDKKWKLFEIELAQYKLEKGKSSQLDDIFKALAQEGMLTDDIIDSYVEKQKAEGEVIKTGVQFAKVLNGLNDSQRDAVTDWVEAYIDSGGDIEHANSVIGGSLTSVVGLTEDQIGVVTNYADAHYRAINALDYLENRLNTFTQDLYDNQLATYEMADAWGTYQGTLYEISNAVLDMNEAHQLLVSEGLQPAINAAAQMWVALGRFPTTKFGNMFDLGEMIEGGLDSSKLPERLQNILDKLPTNVSEKIAEGLHSREIESAKQAFIDAIHNINQETGYFADKTADSSVAFQGYLDLVGHYGITGMDAYSSAVATSALTLKNLESKGIDASDAIKIAGGSFGDLGTMGNTALSSIITDVGSVKSELELVTEEIHNITGALNNLELRDAITIHIEYLISEQEFEEESQTLGYKIKKFFSDIWSGLFLEKVGVINPKDVPFAAKGILQTRGAQHAIIGEAGAEAVVPLEGANRKHGKAILSHILPKYFPDLAFMQSGGISSGSTGKFKDNPMRDIILYLKRIANAFYNIEDSSIIPRTMPIIGDPRSGPPRRGTTETVDTDGEGSSASASGGIFNAIVSVRQGGQKINMEIYMDVVEFLNAINLFKDSVSGDLIPSLNDTISHLSSSITNAISILRSDINDAGLSFDLNVKSAGNIFRRAVEAVTPIRVIHTHVTITRTVGATGKATGGIVGLARGIEKTHGPMFAMIGEAGPEAVVPLAGKHKPQGRNILESIIPKYFPEMTRQTGGISNIDNSMREEMNILGPVTVQGIANVQDMADEFKERYRTTSRR